jgi:cell division inhibitor SulA
MNQTALSFSAPLAAPLDLSAANTEHSNPILEQRVSQICLPNNTSACRYLLPGMLKELNASSDDRWLCWVAQQPVKALMRAGQAKTQEQNRVLQIVSREPHPELLRIAKRALATGKSHTVILVLDYQPSLDDIQQLELSAQAGLSECLVVVEI